jgi:nucleoside-diphosphate-sugar epimerase
MNKILVTGASGFIGRQLLPLLAGRGFEVIGVSRRAPEQTPGWRHVAGDLLDAAFVADLTARERCTHLLHLAWIATPGVYWTSPDNLAWTAASLGLAAAFAANGGRRLVVAGSCAEYDWECGFLSEGRTPCRPATFYGQAKDGLRRLLAAYCPTVGLSFAWGRVFYTFGPGEDRRRLAPGVVLPLLAGRPAPCTHGRQVRDFLYIEDLARAFVALVDSAVSGCVNLASGQPLAVADLIAALARQAGRPDLPPLGAIPLSEAEPPLLVADVRRLHREVGFAPVFSLEQAVARTVNWWAGQEGRADRCE